MSSCLRGLRALDTISAPDRLKTPLIRTGKRGSGDFREASWDEALDLSAGKLQKLKEQYGEESLLGLAGSGACRSALHNTGKVAGRFYNCLGNVTRTHGYYSNTAASYTTELVLGGRYGSDPETLLESELVILWGADVFVTRFGNELESILLELKSRNVPMVVLDPCKTTTADRLGARWIPLYPGTDSAVMAALLYEFIQTNRIDRDFLEQYTTGWDVIEDYVTGKTDGIPKTPEWACSISGMKGADFNWLADIYGSLKPAALIPGLSIQRTLGGEEAYRFSIALQAARGNSGLSGGTTGALVWDAAVKPRCGSLLSPHRPDQPSIPVNSWPDAILEGRKGGFPSDIRAVYNVGTNYLIQGSDLNRSRQALESLDFIITHDFFLTPTARWSDVVFPVSHYLERDDIVFPDNNYLYFSAQVQPPAEGVKDDYELFRLLAGRLGFESEFTENRSTREWLDSFLEKSDIEDYEEFRRTGIFDGGAHKRVGLEAFISNPARNPLSTETGKIHLSAGERPGFRDDFHEKLNREILSGFPLKLVTPHAKYRVNSTGSNLSWVKQLEKDELTMNPRDGAARSLKEGQSVRVVSPRGELRMNLHFDDGVMRGVVRIYNGSWDIESTVNKLTSTEPTTPSMGSRTHSVQVEVISVSGESRRSSDKPERLQRQTSDE
ncbi:MAG: molybdopterin-dependent oxidoreductase [Spirochaetaceae bacterium]|nr:molybdopterin-dependent oxidoreductase [Spirochaetaceae bacterium]